MPGAEKDALLQAGGRSYLPPDPTESSSSSAASTASSTTSSDAPRKKRPLFLSPTVTLPFLFSMGVIGSAAYKMDNLQILVAPVGWAVAYTGVCAILKRIVRKQTLEGYPRWSYFSSVIHQGLTLPIMTAMLLGQGTNMTSESWLSGSWMPSQWIERMIHCSIIGAMLKDYWVYGDANEWFFLLHHLLTVMGCSLCLVMPKGVGLVTANALNAEIASILYNFKVLFPSVLTNATQVSLMGISNIMALVLGYWVVTLPGVGAGYKGVYGTLCMLIFLIRCGGWVQALGEIVASLKEISCCKRK